MIGGAHRLDPTLLLHCFLDRLNVADFPFSQCLVWVPKTWRPDLKPMLRYHVTSADDGTSQTKYLTWDQPQGGYFGHRASSRFFNSDDYGFCEPLDMRGGDWNHAKIHFSGFFDDEEEEWVVIHHVSQYERMVLPTLSEKLIWTEKPSVEWDDLRFWPVRLRESEPIGVGMNPHRGRLRVVTHPRFGGSDLEMVM